MADENKRHNGYTNYETWAVALWIDNDEGSHNYWREQAEECYRDASPTRYSTRRDVAESSLADRLQSDHEDNMPEVSGIFSDLLNAALSEVDWHDVASHILDDDMVDEIDAGETDDDDSN